jgi:uncharacterized protein (TIGR02270 family)
LASLGHPPVFPDIVEEHFDELEFLWEQREAGLFSADWTLMDLAEHEERAEAHLDGLRLSELHGVELAQERITDDDPSSAAAATLILHDAGGPEHRELILSSLGTAGPGAVEGIRWGLRQFDPGALGDSLHDLLEHEEKYRAATAAHVLSFWRLPVAGLESLLGQDDSVTRILALGAAGRLGELYPKAIAAAVEAPDPEVRRAGLEAAARLGVPGLVRHCRAAATREADPDPEAVYFLGVLGEREDLGLLEALLDHPGMAPFAVAALGAMGRVEGIPILLGLMEDEALAVPATSAYKRITGAGDVEGEAPFPPPEVPEGEDEPEDLPPDSEKARADWENRKGSMGPEVPWQMGIAVPPEQFPQDRDTLTLEARKDLYLRLRARGGSAVPDLELEALAVRQMSDQPRKIQGQRN